MTATKTKPESISPAIAAEQSEWLARQAAEYFERSTLNRATPRAREISRRKFFENARLALPSLGLDRFLAIFKAFCHSHEAEAIVRRLWDELQGLPQVANAEPLRTADAAKIHMLLDLIKSLVVAEVAETDDGIETRGVK